jgi:Amt family ammonium transporter
VTFATGLFYGGGLSQLAAETIGVAANFLWVFPVAYGFFFVVEKTMGNRVPAQVEIDGLDIPEMGVLGYVSEDPLEVSSAGREHIATHGPGVPTPEQVFNANGLPKQTPQVPTGAAR